MPARAPRSTRCGSPWTDMLESGKRPSSPAKGSHVASLNPLGKIKDVALGTVLHPRKTAGTVVGTARGTVGLGRDVAGQVGSRLLRRPTPRRPPRPCARRSRRPVRRARRRVAPRRGSRELPPAPAARRRPHPRRRPRSAPRRRRPPRRRPRRPPASAPAKKAAAKKAPAKRAEERRRRRRRHPRPQAPEAPAEPAPKPAEVTAGGHRPEGRPSRHPRPPAEAPAESAAAPTAPGEARHPPRGPEDARREDHDRRRQRRGASQAPRDARARGDPGGHRPERRPAGTRGLHRVPAESPRHDGARQEGTREEGTGQEGGARRQAPAAEADARRVTALPDPALVVLVGPSGSGKSTWAAERYRREEVVSSDALRGVVGSGPHDLDASDDAFDLLERVVDARLGRGLTTVVDTLGTDDARRAALARGGPGLRRARGGRRDGHPGRGVPAPQRATRPSGPRAPCSPASSAGTPTCATASPTRAGTSCTWQTAGGRERRRAGPAVERGDGAGRRAAHVAGAARRPPGLPVPVGRGARPPGWPASRAPPTRPGSRGSR